MDADARNALLRAMTGEVAQIVLEDNRLQALGLSIAQAGGTDDLASYVRLIEILESGGHLDRRVEGLASDQELLRRAADGQGLTRPELAVLLSTAKLALQGAIEAVPLPDDPGLAASLMGSFPATMRAAHADAIAHHQLRREIVATELANRVVNRLGVILPFALAEEASCTLDEIAAAFVVAEQLFGVRALWDEIDAAELTEQARLALYAQVAHAMAAHIGDIHRSLHSDVHPQAAVRALRPAIASLCAHVDSLLQTEPLRRAESLRAELIGLGVPDALADKAVLLVKMDGAVGLARLAGDIAQNEIDVASAFTHLGDRLGIDWLQAQAARMNPSDPWERLLVTGSARDLQQMRLAFLARAQYRPVREHLVHWLNAHEAAMEQFCALIGRARAAAVPTPAMIAELSGQARALLAR